MKTIIRCAATGLYFTGINGEVVGITNQEQAAHVFPAEIDATRVICTELNRLSGAFHWKAIEAAQFSDYCVLIGAGRERKTYFVRAKNPHYAQAQAIAEAEKALIQPAVVRALYVEKLEG